MMSRSKRDSSPNPARVTPELLDLCEQLRQAHERARAAGVFVGDRELLCCPRCDLKEDVASDGRLFTYFGDAPKPDTGLRFEELGEDVFRCPNCRTEVSPPGESNSAG